jgi:hypothetical protein
LPIHLQPFDYKESDRANDRCDLSKIQSYLVSSDNHPSWEDNQSGDLGISPQVAPFVAQVWNDSQ